MSSIKKFNDGEWKKFAQTNADAKNLTTTIDGKTTTIEQAIQANSDDIAKLQRNVSWLALHGGGGSGSGGSSSSVTAKAKITVNGYQTNQQFAIVSGNSLDIAIDFTPKKSSVNWKVTVVIGSYNREFAFSVSSPTRSISFDDFSSQLKTDSTTGVTITAYYPGDENVGEGSSTWIGYIYLADISINAIYDNPISLSSITDSAATQPTVQIIANTPIQSDLSCTTTLYDAGSSYTYDCGDPIGGNTWKVKVSDMFGDTASGGITKASGMFVFDVNVSTVYGDKLISKTSSFQFTVTAEGAISLAVNGISKIKTDPSLISETTMGASLTIEAYLANANGYKVSAFVEGKTDPIWGNDAYSYSGTSRNLYYPFISFSKEWFPDYNTTYQVDFRAFDLVTPNISGESKHFLQIVKSSNKYLTYDPTSLAEQLVGIYSANGSGISGTTLEQFNSICPHMELTSSLPSAKGIYLSVDFYYLNNSTKHQLDDSGLNSLRISNGSFFTIVPEIGQKTFSTANTWTIGLAIKSDEYLEDDVIEAMYGFYDEATNEADGIIIKPHGIYLANGKNHELVVNLVDGITNVIHFVYSNGKVGSYSIWGKGDKNSFFKVYLNGVLSYISTSCPFKIQDDGTIINFYSNKLYVGGVGQNDNEHGNINVYAIEMFDTKLNELGLVVSEANLKVMTHGINTGGTQAEADFEYQTKELSSNFCSLSGDSTCISSLIYNSSAAKFTFDNLYIIPDDQSEPMSSYAPPTFDTASKYKYSKEIQAIPFPIVYLDVSQNENWTLSGFLKKVDNPAQSEVYSNPAKSSKMWYWDPQKSSFSFAVNNVDVVIQGTSTLRDHVKNVNITLPYNKSTGEETMLFVNDKWIPEHTYTLKADIVDSSHSNNASIGSFINTVCGVYDDKTTKGFDFGFAPEAMTNVLNSKGTLANVVKDASGNSLLPNITPKHTVEGFPVLLLVRFYHVKQDSDTSAAGKTFTSLGIYSFNLGRDSVRNIGFRTITGITEISSVTSIPSVGVYNVTEESTVSSFWIERSTDGAIKLSALPDDTSQMISSIDTGSGSFWQTDDEILNGEFQTRYSTQVDSSGEYDKPAKHDIFLQYASTMQQLPIEGTIHYDQGFQQTNITGRYQKYKWNGTLPVKDGDELLDLASIEPTTVYRANSVHTCKYLILAMLFGLRDNFDKNITYRSWGHAEGNQMIYVDFYDMDTALGLTNQGAESQSIIMLFKYIMNQIDSQGIPIARESYNESGQAAELKEMTILPESVGNKLLFSVDSPAIRSDSSISEMTKQWFTMRDKVDQLATAAGYSGGFVDWFMNDFFDAQTAKCGSMFFNYDYTAKYLNTFDSDDVGSSEDETRKKCHGRRREFVRKWLDDHLAFLDSYFYWRGHFSTGGIITTNMVSYLNRYVTFKHSNTPVAYKYASLMSRHYIIPMINEDLDKYLSPTFLIKGKPTNVYIPTNGSDSGSGNSSINYMNSMLSVDWNRFQIQSLSPGSNLDSWYNLIDFARNKNVNTFPDQKYFYDSQHGSQLKSLDLHQLSVNESIQLDITPQAVPSTSTTKTNVFKSLNSIDISNTKGITSLKLSDTPLKKLNVASSNITSLKVSGQPYISVPNLNGCKNLIEVDINDFIMQSDKIQTTSYVNYDLSAYNSLKSISISRCNTLKSLKIQRCTSLTSINIDQCSSLTSVSLISCENMTDESNLKITNNPDLVSITINGCHSLSSFTYQVDDPTKVQAINLSYSRIAQINRLTYNDDGSATYTKMTDAENERLEESALPVLDLKDFTNASFTLQANKGVKAIRFANNLDKPVALPSMWSWGSGGACSNLQRIYGNIVIAGDAFSDTNCRLFSGESSSQIKKIILDTSKTLWENLGIQDKSLVDIFEASNTSYQAVEYNGKTLKFPIKICGKDFNDFDSDEWGRNFSLTGAGQSAFRGGHANYAEMSYILFKIAMFNYWNPSSKITNINGLFRDCENPTLTNYAFKGLGDLQCSLDFTFYGGNNAQRITKAMMSNVPKLTGYSRWFNDSACTVIVDYDAFWNQPYFTFFGTSDINHSVTFTLNSDSAGNKAQISKLFYNKPNLTQFLRFTVYGCDFGMMEIPKSVTKIQSSFNTNCNTVFDFPEVFGDDSSIQYIYDSFKGSGLSVMLRPSSLSGMSSIVSIGSIDEDGDATDAFYSTGLKKFIVKDSYIHTNEEGLEEEYQFTRENANDYAIQNVNFLSDDMIQFEQSFLSNQTQLQCFTHMFENADLSAYNRGQIVSAFAFPGQLFENNAQLKYIPKCMKDFVHPIELTQNGFRNCPNISRLTELFTQSYDPRYVYGSGNSYGIVKYNKGVVSDIPYRLFYHGSSFASQVLSGIEEWKSPQIPPTYAQYNNAINNAVVTTSFVTYKSSIISTMMNVPSIFAQVSAASYSSTITSWFDFANSLDLLSDTFESLTYLSTYIDESGKTLTVRVVRDKEPFRTMYYDLSSISVNFNTYDKMYANLYADILQLSTTGNFTYEKFNTNIIDLRSAFYGNANIKPYSGQTSAEVNQSFKPFMFQWNGSSWYNVSSQMDKFLLDDSWSQNGEVWKSTGSTTVIAYDPTHKNTVDSSMSSLTLTKGDPYTLYARFSDTATSANAFIYNRYGYAAEMKYICAPDLLRYVSNSSSSKITGMFKATSNAYFNVDIRDGASSSEEKKSTVYCGLKGRIPPNLFKTLSKVNNLRDFFHSCKFMTGFRTTNDAGKIVIKYIPDQLFENFDYSLQYLQFMFYNNIMPFGIYENADLDLETPFQNMKSNSSYYKDMSGIFGKCTWLNGNTFSQMMNNIFISKCHGAFTYKILTGSYNSQGIFEPSKDYYINSSTPDGTNGGLWLRMNQGYVYDVTGIKRHVNVAASIGSNMFDKTLKIQNNGKQYAVYAYQTNSSNDDFTDTFESPFGWTTT